MEDRQEQDEVGAGRPERAASWRVVDDELLGEDRHATGRSDAPRGPSTDPAEPVRLAQDGDRGRAARLVGTGARDDVVAIGGDAAGRRRRALDLGDEMEARARPAARRSGAAQGRRPRRPAQGRAIQRGSASARTSARRRAAIVGDDARALDPSRARFRRVSLGAQAAEQLGGRARHRSSGRPARCPPRASPTRPATSSAGPGVEQDDVASRPGLAAQDRLDRCGRSRRGVAAGEPGRRRTRLSPRRRRIHGSALHAPGLTSYSTPLSSSGSSSTPSPWMTNVRSVPSSRATSAIRGGGRARRPRRAAGGVVPAGFVSGPRRLNAVRTPISRRVGPACFIAGWKFGANRNAKPMIVERAPPPRRRRDRSGSRARRGRRPSPAFDVIARLPCLATGTPVAATTSAAAVEMLNVPLPSPPVPTTSIVPSGAVHRARRARASRSRTRRAPRPSRRASAGPRAAPRAGRASPRRP